MVGCSGQKNERVFPGRGVLLSMDDELRKKLASWKVQPEIPSDFQRGVWRRIAARESGSSKAPFVSFWAIRWVSLPRLAAFAFVLGGLTGTGLGLVKSSQANTKNWKTLEAKYVQSIDPYEHLRTY
jgi:hypothetical protein